MGSYTGMPVGAIIAFAGDIGDPVSSPPGAQDYSTDPVRNNPVTNNVEGWGWMVCDGRLLYCRAYPQLFNAIGFLYSQSGDPYPPGTTSPPSDASFRIPDYRGYFLRGVNGTAMNSDGSGPNDPDEGMRKLNDGTVNSGVGSAQQDALQTHWHTYNEVSAPGATMVTGGDATQPNGTANTSLPTNVSDSPPGQSNTVRTSTETRSKNIYVHYLIKYV